MDYMESYETIISSINDLTETLEAIVDDVAGALKPRSFIDDVVETIGPIVDSMEETGKLITTIYPKDFFSGFAKSIQEIFDNPNSLVNYPNYKNQLDNFHWAWPYNITTNELKTIIETVENEREFDNYMINFFSCEKDFMLGNAILTKLPKRHRVIFEQIMKAYKQMDYAIANNALMSIIDNLLAEYPVNPGQVRRKGLLQPVVNLWAKMSDNIARTFRFMMLSHNIDFIFEDYDFSKKIQIQTNKKARRHPAVHGFKYSNQKVDSLMLMNTLWELLSFRDVLKPFKGSLKIVNKKTFGFQDDKVKTILRPIIQDRIIDSLIETKEGLSHEKILMEIRSFEDNNTMVSSTVTSTYLSNILQSMKRHGEIYSVRENGKTKWILKSIHE